jgi:hypothetical protein
MVYDGLLDRKKKKEKEKKELHSCGRSIN